MIDVTEFGYHEKMSEHGSSRLTIILAAIWEIPRSTATNKYPNRRAGLSGWYIGPAK
jgi:hypothetical protein